MEGLHRVHSSYTRFIKGERSSLKDAQGFQARFIEVYWGLVGVSPPGSCGPGVWVLCFRRGFREVF